MKKNLMFLALAAVGLASCNGGFKKGPNGMLYNIHVDKSGPKIKAGDFISVNLTMKNDADSVLYSTYESGGAKPMLYQESKFKGDVLDGIKMLADGDSATIKVFVDSQKMPKPPGFKGKYITYDIKIEKVIVKGNQTDEAFHTTVNNYIKSKNEVYKGQEGGKIKKYIADNNLKVTTTATGLNYVITKPGSGPLPAAGDSVMVNYIGKKVDGKVFDTNIKEEAVKAKTFNALAPYKPITIPLGQARVIPGWDQGLMLLNSGSKAIFVIPSSLAYGEQGNGPISPFTPLVFDIEIVKIIHPDPNAPKPAMPQLQMPQPTQK